MQENGRKIALCHQCSLVRLDAQFPGEHCRSHVRARDKSDTVEEEEKKQKKMPFLSYCYKDIAEFIFIIIIITGKEEVCLIAVPLQIIANFVSIVILNKPVLIT